MTQDTSKEAGALSDRQKAAMVGVAWYVWQSIGSLVWQEWVWMMVEAALFAVLVYWAIRADNRIRSRKAQDSTKAV